MGLASDPGNTSVLSCLLASRTQTHCKHTFFSSGSARVGFAATRWREGGRFHPVCVDQAVPKGEKRGGGAGTAVPEPTRLALCKTS